MGEIIGGGRAGSSLRREMCRYPSQPATPPSNAATDVCPSVPPSDPPNVAATIWEQGVAGSKSGRPTAGFAWMRACGRTPLTFLHRTKASTDAHRPEHLGIALAKLAWLPHFSPGLAVLVEQRQLSAL
jgi:hypothetical protein